MSDNVIILGAGASVAAGVPVLSQFVDRMLEIHYRGRSQSASPISEGDRIIFEKAIRVRESLDGYHGRASFDDWNIEDILSILTFQKLAGSTRATTALNDLTKAIARTIELSCSVQFDGNLSRIQKTGPSIYKKFWKNLLDWSSSTGSTMPAIISLNYDLILERALLAGIIGINPYDERTFGRLRGIQVAYHAKQHNGANFNTKEVDFFVDGERSHETRRGLILEETKFDPTLTDRHCIDFLKLHGSLNFSLGFDKTAPLQFGSTVNDPVILPPIFDKASQGVGTAVWKKAMDCLGSAKNIIICGYSLPATDIYMQYFLKSAIGPNLALSRIFVIDPVFFSSTPDQKEQANLLRERYLTCFSPQLKNRISFSAVPEGTFESFVYAIEKSASSFLFSRN